MFSLQAGQAESNWNDTLQISSVITQSSSFESADFKTLHVLSFAV